MSCVKVARNVIHCLFCSYFFSATDESIERIILYHAPLCKRSLLWNYNFAGLCTQCSGKNEGGQCATSASQTHLRRNVGIPDYLWRTRPFIHTYKHIWTPVYCFARNQFYLWINIAKLLLRRKNNVSSNFLIDEVSAKTLHNLHTQTCSK